MQEDEMTYTEGGATYSYSGGRTYIRYSSAETTKLCSSYHDREVIGGVAAGVVLSLYGGVPGIVISAFLGAFVGFFGTLSDTIKRRDLGRGVTLSMTNATKYISYLWGLSSN
jgi:hypothetical protein